MNRSALPTEEEQYVAYKTVLEKIYSETVRAFKSMHGDEGFDVYMMSSRDHNVPRDATDVLSLYEWGVDEYISDIKKTVDLIKILSGFDRIYINSMEISTALAMIYATQYEEDLKGIISIGAIISSCCSSVKSS